MVFRSALVFLALAAPVAAQTDRPFTELPYTPSLDPSAMDRSVDPCVNFYAYSCGSWNKNNPIPPDQSAWEVYTKLANDNMKLLWGVLERAADSSHARSANEQKIGDFFHACMDETAIAKAALTPLKPMLARIDAIGSVKQLAALTAAIHSSGVAHPLFSFGSNQDFEDSSRIIAFASGGGRGLPDRDYYTKTDAKSVEMRAKYVEHVARILQLAGATADAARAQANTILEIETATAKVSLTRVEYREPHNLFHRVTLAEFRGMTPSFDWTSYFEGIGLVEPREINVTEPKFYAGLEKLLASRPVADWKVYYRWHLLHAYAPLLSQAFDEENFAFFSRYMRGTKQPLPRWKRCARLVDMQLGDALGQVYVDKAFSPEAKKQTVEMTRQIEVEMEKEIRGLDWMSEQTRQRAIEKLHLVVNKVGYPDRWRDYSQVVVKREDFPGNVQRASAFEHRRQLNKIGRPVDRMEWQMTPPTVNAYYEPQMNDINFPAGVLQPPLFDLKMDAAPNYGNTGGTIGHELTHGFDDEGRQYDGKGNLKDWWTEKDAAEFEKRINCIRDQYAQYTVVDDIKINSKLTSGEDVADLGGMIIAWMAWKTATKEQHLESRDGLTPEQRFFVGFAQWDCGFTRPETLRMNAITNPHSPAEYRINGVVVNMPQFQQAFSCKAGQPMVKAADKVCKVW